MKLRVSELFYSVQGEGAQSGMPMVFVRLQGCKMKSGCLATGVICDTEFESGTEMKLEEILSVISVIAPKCEQLLWTGGEPLDQLTTEVLTYFGDNGYRNSVETSGLHTPCEGFDYITVSPKVAEHVLEKNLKGVKVHELRYVRHKGQSIPNPSIDAVNKFISPHSDGYTINPENLAHCIKLAKKHPSWRISVQQHKTWAVL